MSSSSNEWKKNAADVAIIGMAGRFPGAADVEAFWRNLRSGVESIRRFSEAELRAAGVEPARFSDPRYVPASGFLSGMEDFDAGFFGITPLEALVTDPQHRIFLECAWTALEHAGYDPKRYPGLIGVFAGCAASDYLWRHVYPHPEVSSACSEVALGVASDKDFLSTRVSYKLDLRGPSLTIQTACSTSLVAVCVAWQSLLTYQCDLALAGGVSIDLPGRHGYLHREGLPFSADGHCRAFDISAQGTVGGSGAGIVVLKRLEDALAQGDSIYAVIKSTALNNDGSGKVGFTAPSVSGQAQAIAQALAIADVAPAAVSYIETHGTGTPLGDPIELAALKEVFRGVLRGSCAIGSVKTNIGHLNSAAGVAGLIKTVLALHHGELPPSLHYTAPNPKLELEHSPFYVNHRLAPWRGSPRQAGVSAFGVGGTNAHVVLQAAPPPRPAQPSRPYQLVTLSARTDSALTTATANLAQVLTNAPQLPLAEVAYTLHVGRREFDHRCFVICRDSQEAGAALGETPPSRVFRQVAQSAREVAFLFPGAGSQYVNMGRELYEQEPRYREEVDRCAQFLTPLLGTDVRRELYPSEADLGVAEAQLQRPELLLSAMFITEYALARLWQSFGIHPRALLGHSAGEYVAACLAGVFSLADALRLVATRGFLFSRLPAGAMLSVPLSAEAVAPYLGEHLSLAVINGPTSCVVSGPREEIERLEKNLRQRELNARLLPVSGSGHSALVEPILPEFRREVAALRLQAPSLPLVSNVTGTFLQAAEATSPDYWVRHLRQTVRFGDGLGVLLAAPRGILLEVGPGHTLRSLAAQHPARSPEHGLVTSMRHRTVPGSDLAFLLEAVGKLWLLGGPIDWAGFHRGEQRQRVPLPTYPFERQRFWLAARPTPAAPAVATDPLLAPPPGSVSGPSAPPASTPVRFPRPVLPTPYVAPQTGLEQMLCEIWQTFLGIDRVGVADNFAELGVDSLMALHIAAKVQSRLQRRVLAHQLLQTPTIAALARSLAKPADDPQPGNAPDSALVELRGGPARPILFLVHPVGGHVFIYRDLAQALGPEQPVYGVQAQGVDGHAEPLTSISLMVERYVAAIRTLQPEGPYALGGASFGGLLAYAMAQRLIEQGHRVGLLALFDAAGPDQLPTTLGDDADILAYLLFLGGEVAVQAAELRQLTPDQQWQRFWSRSPIVERLVPGAVKEQLVHFLRVWRTNVQAVREYTPPPIDSRLVLFRALEKDPYNAVAPERSWQPLARGGIDVYDVPGNHITMNHLPHVQAIADRLRVYLAALHQSEKAP